MDKTTNKARWINGAITPAIHPQIDTGLDFTCDVEIVQIIKNLNKNDFITGNSCQAGPEYNPSRRYVCFCHKADTNKLTEICLKIKSALFNHSNGWGLTVHFDHHFNSSKEIAWLTWEPILDDILLKATAG